MHIKCYVFPDKSYSGTRRRSFMIQFKTEEMHQSDQFFESEIFG